jgi:hypothetical protein
MKKYDVALALFLGMLGAHGIANAGSPGGLIIGVIADSAAEQYVERVRAFFDRYDTPAGLHACDGAQLNIDSAIFKISPQRINPGVVRTALSGAKQRKKFEAMLANYRDKNHPSGLDGILAIEKTSDGLALKGISASWDEPVHTVKLSAGAVEQASKLDAAVCRALVELPVMRAP